MKYRTSLVSNMVSEHWSFFISLLLGIFFSPFELFLFRTVFRCFDSISLFPAIFCPGRFFTDFSTHYSDQSGTVRIFFPWQLSFSKITVHCTVHCSNITIHCSLYCSNITVHCTVQISLHCSWLFDSAIIRVQDDWNETYRWCHSGYVQNYGE